MFQLAITVLRVVNTVLLVAKASIYNTAQNKSQYIQHSTKQIQDVLDRVRMNTHSEMHGYMDGNERDYTEICVVKGERERCVYVRARVDICFYHGIVWKLKFLHRGERREMQTTKMMVTRELSA